MTTDKKTTPAEENFVNREATEQLNLKTCLLNMSEHYKELEAHKEDCNTKVDAELNLYVDKTIHRISKKDKKIIKKLAQAISANKLDMLKDEVVTAAVIMNRSGTQKNLQLEILGVFSK